MPFALLFFGIIFLVAAYKGNHKELFDLLKDDFSGQDNFFLWVMAIIFLIALGNVKQLKPITDAFLVLVVLAIVLSNSKRGDIFSSFIKQVKSGTS